MHDPRTIDGRDAHIRPLTTAPTRRCGHSRSGTALSGAAAAGRVHRCGDRAAGCRNAEKRGSGANDGRAPAVAGAGGHARLAPAVHDAWRGGASILARRPRHARRNAMTDHYGKAWDYRVVTEPAPEPDAANSGRRQLHIRRVWALTVFPRTTRRPILSRTLLRVLDANDLLNLAKNPHTPVHQFSGASLTLT